MSTETDRLRGIYEDLKQQYDDKSCPIMILSAVEPEDLEYLRNHLGTIVYEYEAGRSYARTLLAYVIVDYVYENYAADEDESANLWPLIAEYLKPYGSYSRDDLINIVIDTIKQFNFPVINSGKRHLNTVLLNSSSRHYSSRFFDYISNQYERMIEREVEYDLHEVAETISDEFAYDKVKVQQMSHSFGFLIQDKSIFPSIFSLVINKMDQRRKNGMEYDLGRWEEAFDEWYLESNSAKFTRSKAELSIEDNDGEYFLKMLFPSSKSVPRSYSISLRIGGQTRTIDIPVGAIRGVTTSQKHLLRYPVHTMDPFGHIYARDSTGIELLNAPSADVRFFNASGIYVKKPSAGTYKALIRRGVSHNLPVIFEDVVSESLSYIETKLEAGREYRVGSSTITLERALSKKSVSVIFPSLGNTHASSDAVSDITPRHPSLAIETDIPGMRISIKGYDGRFVYNELVNAKSGILDLNDLVVPKSGIYRLSLSYEGYRLASVKYMLVEGLSFRADDLILSEGPGDIPFTDFDGDDVLTYSNEMFTTYSVELHGKQFDCRVRTPVIFFNPHPSDDEDDWRIGNPEQFDTNDLEGTIGVSPGCLPDGETVYMIIRSSKGAETIADIVSDGVCSYAISKHVQDLQRNKLRFGIEIRYGNSIFPILKVDTLGKYDIDVQNGIVAITPYKLPSSCRARFEYITENDSIAGPLELDKTVLFDIERRSSLKVTELNLGTNDELTIYSKPNGFIFPCLADVDDESISDMDKADRLMTGNGCRQDVAEAISILQTLSSNGDKDATLKLARLFLNGSMVAADLQKASDYFTFYLDQKAAGKL